MPGPLAQRCRLGSLALLALAAVAAAATRCGGGRARAPSVLLLVMDTTRGDRCGFNGYERPTTPRLDAFAQDAVVFRNAWSPAGWTAPAHASLFTGLGVERHGVYSGGRKALGPHHPTLAEVLRSAGYATACFTNNAWLDPGYGLTRGFGHVDERFRDEGRPYPWAAATHAAAVAWAKARAAEGRPFFLFVNDMEPHLTYAPPAEAQARFVRGEPGRERLAEARAYDFPRTARHSARAESLPEDLERLLSDLYDAEVATLDACIGDLLDSLRDADLLDDMVVIVAGDHGEMLGEHHMSAHYFSLYRAVRHVPLLVRFPGALDGGRAVDDLVRLEDVMPTVLELCGAPVPVGIDGAALTRGLTGRVSRAMHAEDLLMRARLQEQAPGIDARPLTLSMRAVADGRWHYLEFGDGRRELYDVREDPLERDDRAGREPAEVARLAALLRAR